MPLRLPHDVDPLPLLMTFASLPSLTWQQTYRLWPALGSGRSVRRALMQLTDAGLLQEEPYYEFNTATRAPRPARSRWSITAKSLRLVQRHFGNSSAAACGPFRYADQNRLVETAVSMVEYARESGLSSIWLQPDPSVIVGEYRLQADLLVLVRLSTTPASTQHLTWSSGQREAHEREFAFLVFADRGRPGLAQLESQARALAELARQGRWLDAPPGQQLRLGRPFPTFVAATKARVMAMVSAWWRVSPKTAILATYVDALASNDWFSGTPERNSTGKLLRA